MAKREMCYIDLFAGAGGLSLGLYNAGLRGLFAIEKNKDAFSTLQYNLIDNKKHFKWPDWLPVTNHDIRDIVESYNKELMGLQGQVDLVVGGPPCQGFSMAGKRDHSDIRNTMVHYYLDIIKLVRPAYLVLENVHGFTLEFKQDSENKPYSAIVIEQLKNMGYYVKTKEIRMNDFGIPQKRVRFILVGSLKNNIDDFFEKLYIQRDSFFESKGLDAYTTVEDALGDLLREYGQYPCPDCKQSFLSGVYGPVKSSYQRCMRIGTKGNPDSHRFANHTQHIINMQQDIIDKVRPGVRITPSDGIIDGLKRRGVTLLDKKGQASTVTTHPDDFVHYCEARILTVREMARLQGFPDWYKFRGKYTTGGHLRRIDVPRYTQVGNAVPPLFAEQIGCVLKEKFNEI